MMTKIRNSKSTNSAKGQCIAMTKIDKFAKKENDKNSAKRKLTKN